jgi:hypothetical protein|tara:strand:- start:14 stop:304 length:291 start_codon:yes stop_codon:yes gene_type:complete
MDDNTLLTLATGPTSSLILLLGMGLGTWRFFSNVIVPSTTRWVDSHLAQVDRLIEEHAKDREAWLTTIRQAQEQQDRIERKVGGLYGRLDALKDAS